MPNPEAARLGEVIRAAAKRQGLSDSALAERVGRILGRPYSPVYVGRRLSGKRPLIQVSEDLYAMCEALSLDMVQVVADAIRAEFEGEPISTGGAVDE